jgi:hypothetical protein
MTPTELRRPTSNGSTKPGVESGAGRGRSRKRGEMVRESFGRTWLQPIVAVILIGIYIAILWVMFSHRADKEWDRMVFLLSGYEAIVFVAVGYFFGTQVQRGSVEVATDQAEQAREDLDVERNRADRATHQKGSADALAMGFKEYASRHQSRPSSPGSADKGWDSAARGTDAGDETALAILIGLADEVLGSGEQR